MTTVTEIEAAIEQLPRDEKLRLRDWFLRQMWPEADSDILPPRSYQKKVLDAIDEP